jgi:type VI secretion system protein ImpA
MAGPHVLDFDTLLAPIQGSDPSGSPLPDDVRRKLDELRREPDAFEPGGSDKKADWYGVITLAEDTLTTTSKDLLVAVRLTEAMAKRDGYSGLHQGLLLLARLVGECWDRLHPQPEPGDDLSVRIGPFLWMNHSTKGARFPTTVANLPFFKRDETNFSYVYVAATARPAQREEFERVFESLKAAELQEFKEVADHVRGSYAALKDLGAALDQHFGENAPDLTSTENPDNLGRILNGCVDAVDRLLKKSGLEGGEIATAEQGGALTPSQNGAVDVSGGDVSAKRASREALYRQIGNIADILSQLEPHSPIPFLLKRVVRLGALPFPELMRELVRESTTLEEFDRLLGTKPPEPTESSY